MDAIQRGQKANEIISNPLWEEAFQELESVYIQIIKDLPPNDIDRLKHYKQALVSVSFIKGHIETVLQQGELTARDANLTEESKVTQLFRKF